MAVPPDVRLSCPPLISHTGAVRGFDAVSTSRTSVCFFSSGPLVLAFSAVPGNGIWVGREDPSHQPLVAQIKGLLRPSATANVVLV